MGRLEIRLLGQPAVARDGVAVPSPRGAKPWALLAHLLLADRALPRPDLAALLFCQADDPLGALRWNLAEVRRLLGLRDVLRGPVPTLPLPPGTSLDVAMVDAGDPGVLEQPGVGQDLLAGLSFADSPGLEVWLAGERSRVGRRVASLLRSDVLRLMGRGEHQAARHQATRLVVLDPLDEGHQALLIRAHAQAGAVDAARAQYERCRGLLADELDTEPGPAVQAAARSAWLQPDPPPATARPDIVARSQVAWESFLAGAVDHGIGLARQTVEMADHSDHPDLGLVARLYLGAMLGMTARSWDEAAALLSQAASTAHELQQDALAAMAHALLAGNEMMRADYDAVAKFANASLASSQDRGAQALSRVFLGAVNAEMGRTDRALTYVREAVGLLQGSDGDPIVRTWAAAHACRVLLMAGELSEARHAAELAVEIATMPVARSWPLALLAEVDLARGDTDHAQHLAQRAIATAAAVQIPWQQAIALRAQALATAASGDPRGGIDILVEALRHAERSSGEGYPYHWPIACTLDSLATLTSFDDPAEAVHWATRLREYATTTGMRAYTH